MKIGQGVLRPPGDCRNFVHKRIIGGIKGFIRGGPLGAASGFVSPGGRSLIPQRKPSCPVGHEFNPLTGQCVSLFAAECARGEVRDVNMRCVPAVKFVPTSFSGGAQDQFIQGTEVGKEQQLLPFGEAVMGRFGAGLKPAVFSQQRRACPRGSILGAPEADGTSLCYNRSQISNKQRAWPRGRRPLLTGGEMRAISIAGRAAKRLQAKQKQLQELGLLKKPAAPRRKALPPGTAGAIPRVVQIQQE